jgi:hypothetical protein
MRPILALLAATGMTFAVPALASAGTVTAETRCASPGACVLAVHFVAAPGEANDLRVNVGSRMRFSDANHPIELATTACTREDDRSVNCNDVDEFDVRLGDGDDRFAHNPPYFPGPRGYQPTVAYGEAGDDVLVGYSTADLLDGGDGADFIRAHEGDDTVTGGPGDDHLEGMEGDDTVAIADAGAPLGADFADGGPGTDLLDYAAEQRPLVVDLAAGAGGGAATRDLIRGIENLRGGSGADELSGDNGANAIAAGGGGGGVAGRGGDDVLDGGDGSDTLDGGEGDDTVTGNGRAIDLLYGGSGDDLLVASGGGFADAGDGADRVRVATAPDARLRVRCRAGDDVASVQRLVSLGTDCEWLALGEQRIEVHRRLRLSGRSARARVRGVPSLDDSLPIGRLTLRETRTGRVLGRAPWTGRALRTLVFRPRLSRAIVRRIRAGRPLAVTVEDRGTARGRATLTR